MKLFVARNSIGISIFISMMLLSTTRASATTVIARFGPAGIGGGGPNPIGLPPEIADTEVSIVTAAKTEINIALFPGILVGKRFNKDGYYGSGGGGAVFGALGLGLGGYAAIGYETSGSIKFNVDFKQAIAVGASGLMSSYALRIGAGCEF